MTATRILRFTLLVVSVLSGSLTEGRTSPAPPCDTIPTSLFPPAEDKPKAQIWHAYELPRGWSAPSCLDIAPDAALVIAVSARFRSADSADALLSRFGAVSRLVTLRYWSVTDRRWEGLVSHAAAVDRPGSLNPRPDFGVDEMKSGHDLFFIQSDNRSSGTVTFRMRVLEAAPDRVQIEVENVSAIRFLLFQIYPPRGLRVIYFLMRASPGIWIFYSLTDVASGASSLVLDDDRSYINRAVAGFRYVAGIPSDSDPPAAP